MAEEISVEQQEAAAFLRERFLYFIASLPAKPCKIYMQDNSEASAQIRAIDLSFENIIVENLKTQSTGDIPKAILRTTDVLSISFKDC